jgi:hypothetical protein
MNFGKCVLMGFYAGCMSRERLLMMVFKTRFFVKFMLYLCLMAKGALKQASSKALQEALTLREKQKIQRFLSFENLVNKLRERIKEFPDRRIGKNISKSLEDAALGAFSIFYMQNPSFLSHQKLMETTKGKNNARSLFGIQEILSQNHIRNLLDVVDPQMLNPVFIEILNDLREGGYLEEYRSYKKNILIGLDATQYFSSKKISCKQCNNRRRGEEGSEQVDYYHCVVSPVLVKPGLNRVISLPPEFIIPQDGSEKQDCEYNASKRWFEKFGECISELGGVTILGDDLYCKQPICEEILRNKFDFILVCKPDSHKTLYQYLEFLKEDIEEVRIKRWKGKRREVDTYRFYNQVPIRDGEKGVLDVNWCEVVTTNQDGEVIYENSFATSHQITRENVALIVEDGRARWKVENENYNVLKNRGYHLEHNFGHGKEHLSSLLAAFNLLAFLFHTVLEIVDEKYALIRRKLVKRMTFFKHLQVLTCYWYFENWDVMMLFMIEGLELEVPDPG